MKSLEYKILRILVFILLLSLSYHFIFSFFTPLIAPPKFLNNFKFIGFVVTFFGLHTFFALCTFMSSRVPAIDRLSLITLGASIFIPTIYLILNINYLSTLNISAIIVILFSSLIFDFIRKDAEGNSVRKYIRVLINPFYLDDEDMQF
tara:strand:+ start:173 stop:616 length:444 start_codon:yes stop_codon:yes gene_type:complete